MLDNPLILLLVIVSLLTREISSQAAGFQIGAGGARWRMNCDMVGPDIATKIGPGEKCGEMCINDSGCHVFTWTSWNGGTCWMKGNNNWSLKELQGASCGYVPSRVAHNDARLTRGIAGGLGGIGTTIGATNIINIFSNSSKVLPQGINISQSNQIG